MTFSCNFIQKLFDNLQIIVINQELSAEQSESEESNEFVYNISEKTKQKRKNLHYSNLQKEGATPGIRVLKLECESHTRTPKSFNQNAAFIRYNVLMGCFSSEYKTQSQIFQDCKFSVTLFLNLYGTCHSTAERCHRFASFHSQPYKYISVDVS